MAAEVHPKSTAAAKHLCDTSMRLGSMVSAQPVVPDSFDSLEI